MSLHFFPKRSKIPVIVTRLLVCVYCSRLLFSISFSAVLVIALLGVGAFHLQHIENFPIGTVNKDVATVNKRSISEVASTCRNRGSIWDTLAIGFGVSCGPPELQSPLASPSNLWFGSSTQGCASSPTSTAQE